MVRKKLSEECIQEIIKEYKSGESPSNLSTKWGVHPTTIRRYLRDRGASTPRQSHRVLITDKDKVALRKILLEYNIKNPDSLISALDKHFRIEERKDLRDEDFITIII